MSIIGSTSNGATSYKSTGNSLVNLFFNIGASRNNQNGIKNDFDAAMAFDMRKAVAILLWARSPRGGAGERQTFRTLLKELIESDLTMATKVIRTVPTIGRFDDLDVAFNTPLESIAIDIWKNALTAGNALAFKWIDRSNAKMRVAMGFRNEAEFRKFISAGRKNTIVESKMCSNDWGTIQYGKLPSVAGSRYAKAFKKHDAARFSEFMGSKDTKVNGSVNFPHDVYRLFKSSSDSDVRNAASKYWEALAELEVSGSILPICDVSGSMSGAKVSGSVTAMDVSVSLGVFLSQRMKGAFQNKLVTFSESPTIVELPNTKDLERLFSFVERMDWGGSTNIERAYEAILSDAIKSKAKAEDMPSMLLILSDMEFNPAQASGYHNHGSLFNGNVRQRTPADTTLHNVMKKKFSDAGYTIPKICYWHLNAGGSGTYPVMKTENDVAMVSGYSPQVLKSVLSAKEFTAESIMDEAIAPFLSMVDG